MILSVTLQPTEKAAKRLAVSGVCFASGCEALVGLDFSGFQ